ncbi:thioester-forming surface-anchored protein [Tractidigestivibacter sp.]|uniref:thioester-forming surface-anchored protein n=1 Tax=Tractidigestivibacter sp. TaxID=2847320 RepID=UPI002A909F52|nr:thioester-forming surface-anchored protein [Tractidigestivibacter sp.]MDY5272302.1 thioester-forming surface-anchored protein [Tractidigestivibacter sp.]
MQNRAFMNGVRVAIVALFLVLAGVARGVAYAIPGETGSVYHAYAEDSSTPNTNLYVYPESDKSHLIVAYCFNVDKQWPVKNKDYMNSKNYYLNKDAHGVAHFATKPRMQSPGGAMLTDDEFDQAVLKIILNGYPNNRALQEKYNLTDDEFRMVTQEALHYYADSMTAPGRINVAGTNYRTVYDILIGVTTDDAVKQVPGNAVINILKFDPESPLDFQNLLTVDFRRTPEAPSSLDVTFSKVAAGQGGELAGATLAVTGNGVNEEWVSTGTARVLSLAPGEYTLTETAAPDGYLVASAVSFRVTDDLALEVRSADGAFAPAGGATVRMVDEAAPSDKPENPVKESPRAKGGPKLPFTGSNEPGGVLLACLLGTGAALLVMRRHVGA